MKVYFETNSGSIGVLGTYAKVDPKTLKHLVRMFPLLWIRT